MIPATQEHRERVQALLGLMARLRAQPNDPREDDAPADVHDLQVRLSRLETELTRTRTRLRSVEQAGPGVTSEARLTLLQHRIARQLDAERAVRGA